MTQSQIDRAVAGRTGETLATIRRRGFQPVPPGGDPTPMEVRLVVDCPSCRRPVPHPGHTRDGHPALAECADPRCDLYFEFDPAGVYAARCDAGLPGMITRNH